MSTKLSGFPIEITPTLLTTGYTSGQVLFSPEEITSLNRSPDQASALLQLGIFWDMADAPEISLYFFHEEPAGWGDAGDTPAPTFDERSTLIGRWDIDSANNQGYETMPGSNSVDNSYALATGYIAFFSSDDKSGYLTATINSDTTDDLSDKLKITLMAKKNT